MGLEVTDNIVMEHGGKWPWIYNPEAWRISEGIEPNQLPALDLYYATVESYLEHAYNAGILTVPGSEAFRDSAGQQTDDEAESRDGADSSRPKWYHRWLG